MSLLSIFSNEELVEKVDELVSENTVLKSIVQRMESQQSTIISKLDDVLEMNNQTSATVDEVKTTSFFGKKAVFLPQAYEEVSKLTNREIRSLIHEAAMSLPGKKRKGYTYIYNKLKNITGVNVYKAGKMILKKSDGIEGWSKDPSYINTILYKGVEKEAAIISLDILRRN